MASERYDLADLQDVFRKAIERVLQQSPRLCEGVRVVDE